MPTLAGKTDKAMLDYKVVREIRDAGRTKVLVRFYEGAVTTESEDGSDVTRYRRTKCVGEGEYVLEGELQKPAVQNWLNARLGEVTAQYGLEPIVEQSSCDSVEASKLKLVGTLTVREIAPTV